MDFLFLNNRLTDKDCLIAFYPDPEASGEGTMN
ncbi:hypothetical protein EV198_3002 [Roseivirga ehrenbergii]|nr:hypothetical protein EV198_3002 [Roseivirga ehrenbergii]